MSKENIQLTVASIHSKIEKLIFMHVKLKEEYENLSLENEVLGQKVEEQKNYINKLEEKNKVIKLAKVLSGGSENSSDIKNKINELVREIDKCIAQLNK